MAPFSLVCATFSFLLLLFFCFVFCLAVFHPAGTGSVLTSLLTLDPFTV